MKAIFRYRTSKPLDGHFSFQLHEAATVLAYSEHWHIEKGWEVLLDALENTSVPKERRSFFMCNGGDELDFLGEYPDVYFIARHEAKSYTSYLFETTHLSETERAKGRVQSRFVRPKPHVSEMSLSDRRLAG